MDHEKPLYLFEDFVTSCHNRFFVSSWNRIWHYNYCYKFQYFDWHHLCFSENLISHFNHRYYSLNFKKEIESRTYSLSHQLLHMYIVIKLSPPSTCLQLLSTIERLDIGKTLMIVWRSWWQYEEVYDSMVKLMTVWEVVDNMEK